MFTLFIWPIFCVSMFVLIAHKGAIKTNYFIYLCLSCIVGICIAICLRLFKRRPQIIFFLSLALGVLWAITVFAIGYPNLYVPGIGVNSFDVIKLGALASLPILIIIIGKLILREKF